MTRPFRKALLHLLLLLLTLASAAAVPAQQTGDDLFGALQEAREAGVSEATLNQLLALAYEKQFEPSGMAGLLSVIAQCKRENLPLEPFLSKIEEGLSKRIPAARIEQVLKARLQDYRFTRSLINETARLQGKVEPGTTELHVRLTETLYCGLSRENLTHLLGSFPAAPLPEVSRGAEALASLKQLRFDPQLTDKIVETAMKQGYFTVEQRDFARIVAAAKRKGLSDDQIAATALEVMKNRGSESDLSSRLGITDQDQSRQGPQMQKNSPTSGSPAGKVSSTASTRNKGNDIGKGHKASSNRRGSGSDDGSETSPTSGTLAASDPADGSAGGRTPDGTVPTGTIGSLDYVPGSGIGKGSNTLKAHESDRTLASVHSTDMNKSSRPASDPGNDRNSKTSRTPEPSRPASPANSPGNAQDSSPAPGSSPNNDSTTGKTSDPSNTADAGNSSVTTEGSGSKPGSSGGDGSVPVPGSSDENSSGANDNSGSGGSDPSQEEGQDEAKATFTAAGTITAINSETLTMLLSISEASQALEQELGNEAEFALSEAVVVKAESSAMGIFDLDLGNLAPQGDYLRVTGKELADGTFLIERIVLSLDSAEDFGDDSTAAPAGGAPESLAFAAAGTVVAIDQDGLTLTLEIDQVNYVLAEQIDSEAPFVLSVEAKVKTEPSNAGVFDLEIGDLAAGDDYVRVFGRKFANGDRLITHIVLYLEE